MESSSSSSTSTPSIITTTMPFDIEEIGVVLATSHPKKRAGRRVFKETRHPIFRGVRRRNGDKWVCELRVPNNKKNTRIWLGTYPTPEMAARAHDVAALALKGKSACVNFADSTWRLPVPCSLDAKDIRKAASMAAEMFRPHHKEEEEEGEEESSSSCSSSRDEYLCIRDDCKSGFDDDDDDDDKERNSGAIVDVEELFDMPMLLREMAQGLLVSPPGFYYNYVNYRVHGDVSSSSSSSDYLESYDNDLSLWSY